MRRFLLLAGLALAVGSPPIGAASADEPAADLRPVARRLSGEVVAPAYAAFAAAARQNAETWEAECRGERPSRERLAARHRATARAWWAIEFVRFGPVGEDFRAERIDFWPERRNATTRGLAELLDPAAPEPTLDFVRSRSAAVQGLPALERLVFDGKGAVDGRACALGRAISANLAATAEEITTGWATAAARAEGDEAAAREMVARLVTDTLTEFQTLIDAKLGPLGKSAETARPDALQGRRSGAERDALAAPIEGMARIVGSLVDGRAEGATVVATLDTARSVANGLPERIGPLVADPKRRSQPVLLRDALRSAQDTALSDLPALVGISVGFNSRDGD